MYVCVFQLPRWLPDGFLLLGCHEAREALGLAICKSKDPQPTTGPGWAPRPEPMRCPHCGELPTEVSSRIVTAAAGPQRVMRGAE